MKKFSPFFCLLVVAIGTNAQTTRHIMYKPVTDLQKHNPFVSALLQNQRLHAKKTTLAAERLRGSSNIVSYFSANTNIDFDSSVYKYSGNRGSQFDLNNLAYAFPATPYDYKQPLLNTNAYSNNVEVLCDTEKSWNYDATATLKPANNTYASYDINNTLLFYSTIYNDTTYFNPDIRYYNTYNAAGYITANLGLKYGAGGAWDSSYKRFFTYNASNQLITDSLYSYTGSAWILAQKYVYDYDGSGNVNKVSGYNWNGTVWKQTSEYDQTYYTDNKLQTSITYYDIGKGLQPSNKDTFGYSTGVSYYTYLNTFNYDSTGWTSQYLLTKHVNAKGLPDSAFYNYTVYFLDSTGKPIGTGVIILEDSISYNTYNDPVVITQYIQLPGDTVYNFNARQHYYYQLLPTSIPAQQLYNTNIKIFPNPARDQISVTLSNEAINKNIYLGLYNVSGQLVRTETIPWHTQTQQVSLAGIVPGIYFLSVADASGNKWPTQKIVRQ